MLGNPPGGGGGGGRGNLSGGGTGGGKTHGVEGIGGAGTRVASDWDCALAPSRPPTPSATTRANATPDATVESMESRPSMVSPPTESTCWISRPV